MQVLSKTEVLQLIKLVADGVNVLEEAYPNVKHSQLPPAAQRFDAMLASVPSHTLFDAIMREVHKTVRCVNCGKNRTGKGSLIVGKLVYCDTGCYDEWRKKVDS